VTEFETPIALTATRNDIAYGGASIAAATLDLDPELLARLPVGYRHLGYLQTKAGFTVHAGLPGLTGPVVQRLYNEGTKWLAGSASPGDPR
jgi:hypothetical protein